MSPHENKPNGDDLGFLQDMIEAVRNEAPEEAQWQAARRNLMVKLESSRKENRIMTIIRKSVSARVRWAAAFGIAAVVVGVVIGLNPWGKGPGDVYAAAVERLKNARTLSCTCADDYNPGPFELAYKEPGRMRLAIQMGFWPVVIVVNHETHKGIMLYPQTKQYDELTGGFTPNPEPANLIDDLRSLPSRAEKELGMREMDGRKVLGFLVSRDRVGELKNIEVWVDAKTGDPVRLEGEHEVNEPVTGPDGATVGPNGTTLTKTRTVHRVMTNIKFNVEMDDSLFDTNPPQGWSVGPRTMSYKPPVKKDK